MEFFRIASREIGYSHPPFIIAEMSGNHNQSLVRALDIVETVAGARAHALMIQTYTAFWDVYKFAHNDIKTR